MENLNIYYVHLFTFQPFLLEGFKFDLRVYVLVTSCDPLRIFLYHDGLVSRCIFKSIILFDINVILYVEPNLKPNLESAKNLIKYVLQLFLGYLTLFLEYNMNFHY